MSDRLFKLMLVSVWLGMVVLFVGAVLPMAIENWVNLIDCGDTSGCEHRP